MHTFREEGKKHLAAQKYAIKTSPYIMYYAH